MSAFVSVDRSVSWRERVMAQIELDIRSLPADLVDDARFARRLLEAGKLDQFHNRTIVIHQGRVVAANSSSFTALNDAVQRAGSDRVYSLSIPGDADDDDWLVQPQD